MFDNKQRGFMTRPFGLAWSLKKTVGKSTFTLPVRKGHWEGFPCLGALLGAAYGGKCAELQGFSVEARNQERAKRPPGLFQAAA